MFDCKKCEVLASEVNSLREMISKLQEQNGKLVDRLIAVTTPDALAMLNPVKPYDPKEYYGNEGDEVVAYDEFGQRVVVVKGQSN